jgi:hypothetical protein
MKKGLGRNLNQRIMDNDTVWQSLEHLSDRHPIADFVRTLSSPLGLAPFEFITHQASSLHNNVPCHVDLSKFSLGAFNVSYSVVFEDTTRWLLRIRAPNGLQSPILNSDHGISQATSRMLQSSIDTMRYVKANSLMPVPEIYFYDTTCNNPIGASFIVMEFLEGVPIPYSDIDSENIEQTTKIYKQICLTAYQLLSVRFDQIGGVYMDSSTGVVIGPKFGSDGKAYGPINTTDEYYKTLVNEYWKSAVSSLGANYEVPENWNWKTATKFEREVFTAYLHLQCLSRLDISQLNNDFCLQHHDFHLRNFLVDKELNIVGVIDWDESSTIPVLGFDPLSFCPNRKSDRERCLKYLAEI